MKTAKSNRDEIRANTLAIPMTRAEKLEVEKHSKESGLSMSAFVRVVLNKYFKGGN